MAVAFLPIISDARSFMNYSTTSLDEGEWIMIMKRPRESAGGSGLVAPFDKGVWYLILVSLLAVGPVIWGIIALRHKITKDTEQEPYPLPHCIWFVYGALMKQGSTLSPIAGKLANIFTFTYDFDPIETHAFKSSFLSHYQIQLGYYSLLGGYSLRYWHHSTLLIWLLSWRYHNSHYLSILSMIYAWGINILSPCRVV